MKNLVRSVIVAAAVTVFSGCAVNNNYLQPSDFAERLRKDGVEVTATRPLLPDPFRATSGAAISVGNGEIGVYKYDNTSKIQKKRLEQVAESRRLYINGIPYPVVVHGSFVFFGLEKNSKKHDILRSIRRFD